MIATALWGCVYLVCTHVYSGGFITSEFSYYIYFSIRPFWPIGRVGCITRQGPITGGSGLSCIRLVYFTRKSTEFHDMQTECQIILPTAHLS